MWTEYQRHPGRTRKKKSLCGPSTNGPGRTRKKKSLCGPSTNGIPVGPERRNPYVDRVPTAPR